LLIAASATLAPGLASPGSAQEATQEPAQQVSEAKPAEQKKEEAKKDAAEAAPVAEPERFLAGFVETGFRILPDPGGDFQTYRSLVNLGEGWKVFSFDLTLDNPSKKGFDRFQLLGSGWGGEPYSQNRLMVGKQKWYQFDLDYRNVLYFNNVPSFANPFFDRGVLLNQRGLDARRRWLGARVDLLPSSNIVPFFLYEGNWASGRGVWPLVGDGNEFPIVTEPDDLTRSVRGGVRLEYTNFHATVEAGRTTFQDDQTVYSLERNVGNRLTPILGRQLFLNNGTQAWRIRGESVLAQGMVNWTPFPFLDLHGQFVYTRPETDAEFNQSVAGQFYRQSALRFYSTGRDAFSGDASLPHTSGQAGFEVRPISRLRILNTWMTDRFHNTTAGLLISTIDNLSPEQLAAADRLELVYNRNQTDVLFDVTNKWLVRGGFKKLWGRALTRGGLASLTTFERSELDQNVFNAGSQIRPVDRMTVYVDFERGTSNATYFRTSLADYYKGSVRARYQAFTALSFNVAVSALDNFRSVTGTGRDGAGFEFRQHLSSVGFFWNPKAGKRFTLTGDYARSALKTNIDYFIPTGGFGVSNYRDHSHIGALVADLGVTSRARFSFGGSFVRSAGNRATEYYQPLARVLVPVGRTVSLFADWRYWGYHQPFYLIEGFRAHALSIGFRMNQ
jgi:hypothetical protein